MAKAVLITGSNEGDREALLSAAKDALGRLAGMITAQSPIVATSPWGEFAAGDTPEDFLNQVLVVETRLSPMELLSVTQHIESELGRKKNEEAWRGERCYSSRPIDIDILFYDDAVIDSERLAIPHPGIASREFVLEPLAAVMPDFRHPVTGETVAGMLGKLSESANMDS